MSEERKEEIVVAQETQTPEQAKPAFQWKKWWIAAVIVVVVIVAAMFLLRSDYTKAQQVALNAAGGGQIQAQEAESDFLFFNEYSFDILNNNGQYCEIEAGPFGNITSMEIRGW